MTGLDWPPCQLGAQGPPCLTLWRTLLYEARPALPSLSDTEALSQDLFFHQTDIRVSPRGALPSSKKIKIKPP